MNPVFLFGLVLTGLGLAGYVVGVTTAYPGRSFSVTLLMVGVALVAMRGVYGLEADGP